MSNWRTGLAWPSLLRRHRFYLIAIAVVVLPLALWLTKTASAKRAAANIMANEADIATASDTGDTAGTHATTVDEPIVVPPDEVAAFVIHVNGQPIVGLSSRAEAEAVVDDLEQQYTARWQDDDEAVEAFGFREHIEIVDGHIPLTLVRNREEAKRILLRGTDRILNYVVQRGDSLWTIAAERGMDVEDLEKANPEVKPEALQIGQELNMIVAEPYVHTTATVRRSYVANIAFRIEEREDPDLYPWQSTYEKRGVYGRQRVTELLDYEDDQIVDRRVVATERLSDPETAIYLKGTKLAPNLGDGQFIVPLQGGTFTSGFGWRWGSHHNGIDLAAPTGTPVYAADAGTVVEAGWKGGLGYAVIIDHGGGKFVTVYGHFSSYVVGVGDQVAKGDTIGYVGSTGHSTGPHLHFEIHVDGSPHNPLNYFPD